MDLRPRAALLLCCLGLTFSAPGVASDAEAEAAYREGVAAFRAEDYDRALQRFEVARAEGRESPTLLYNLGVTHYRLGNYVDAERFFRMLADDPEWRTLAHYNLGRVAERRGDDDEAVRLYRRARAAADDARLRRLADERLDALRPQPAARAARSGRRWSALVSAAGGYDDNAVAFPDRLQESSSRGADEFWELLGYGQVYLRGGAGDGLRAYGYGYAKDYIDLDVVDVQAAGIGLLGERGAGDWTLRYGGAGVHTAVDGERLTSQLQGRLGASRELGAQRLGFAYRSTYHDAGGDVPQLQGWEHRLDAQWGVRNGDWRLRARYRLEIHDREDLETTSAFLSYSPMRHRLRVAADWTPARRWSWTAGAELRLARYDDVNRLVDVDGIAKQAERETDRVDLWIEAGYELTRRWEARAELRYTHNDDVFELYTYDRTEAKLAFEYAL